ncbi:dihydroxyacetone kinase [Pararhizobium antarcticum]|uniref:Dihydroxyacetone kinase n=2 Tax=Pararhizobium antarcticum TaxID=1798805 RepID=A0A657M0K1_9HYPH|nr:dihydroxyacetone kinase [Rhizobium sp. 58]OJG01594.1 dihydroxyacetone kinase [Pararhizobium antarcticum]
MPVLVRIGPVIAACCADIARHADRLNRLDGAIGDGDHGTNMQRGCEALLAESQRLEALPLAQSLAEAGRILVMTIGGAAGPLYGTLLMELGRAMSETSGTDDFPTAFAHAVNAVARRGKSGTGDKTLLDVLFPLSDLLAADNKFETTPAKVAALAEMTVAMRARRGRASFLGERSIGHMDPGAASCALLVAAVCREINGGRRA